MRIIYLHQHFNTPAMQGGTRSYEMARRLAAMGHDVQLVTADRAPGSKGRTWRETNEAGFRVHWFPAPYSNRMNAAGRTRAFSRFAIAASKKALQLKGDVVFATSAPLTIAIPAIAVHTWRKTPYVFEVRDLWPETPIAMGALKNPLAIFAARGLERLAYSHAKEIVALSPEMQAGVVRAGVPRSRVTVIPNSCDFDLFGVKPEAGCAFRERHDWLKNRPLVVYTGALGRVNGLQYLVRVAAAALPLLPSLRFLVVGDGCEHDSVRALAHRLGVWQRNFFMLPAVAKRDVPAILSAADIASSFTIDAPALWANSANKVFDAFAAGKPIAINHEGWLADLIRRHAAGLVLPAADCQAAAAMLAAAANRQWCEHAGRAAKRLGRDQFDRDLLARKLEAVLTRAAVGSSTAPAPLAKAA
jgi:glycosyltransferase involved in cell wall biosynthesis